MMHERRLHATYFLLCRRPATALPCCTCPTCQCRIQGPCTDSTATLPQPDCHCLTLAKHLYDDPEKCGTLLRSANSAFMLGPASAEGLRSAGRSSRLPGPPGGGGGGGGPPLEPEPFFAAAGALAALAAPPAAVQQWDCPYNVTPKVERNSILQNITITPSLFIDP